MDLNMTLDEVIAKSGIKDTLRRSQREGRSRPKKGGANGNAQKGTVARAKANESRRKKGGANNNQQKKGNNNAQNNNAGNNGSQRRRRFRKVGTKANAGRAQVTIRNKKNGSGNNGNNNNSRRGQQQQQAGAKANRLARGRSNREIQDARRKQSTSKKLQQRREGRGNNNGNNNGQQQKGGAAKGGFNFHVADSGSKLSARFARK